MGRWLVHINTAPAVNPNATVFNRFPQRWPRESGGSEASNSAMYAVWPILIDLVTASGDVYLFARACELEKLEAAQAHREWSWEGARKSYLTEVRMADRQHPEWNDLVRLTALREAVEDLVKLEADITGYLLAPAQGISR